MQVTENEIMNLIQERGLLRFSTLMLKFHISSMQAIQIVEEYKKRGIIDEKCRATSGVKVSWKNPYAGEAADANEKNTAELDPESEKVPVEAIPKRKNKVAVPKELEPASETKAVKKHASRKKPEKQQEETKPVKEPVQMSFLEETIEKPKRKATRKSPEGNSRKKKDMDGQMSLF
ncbi:hypothetical protein [Blautia sp. MCC283]|uniref:hypothetical protein n=1 Tax=Blautia sp. MCC283 TaxID=2592640 RepID=UPI001C02046D|nr:hypothetical protein [Blautia sp. MCC283]MBT9841507.1 hypothetical protein [Blautia sp. MCC283]